MLQSSKAHLASAQESYFEHQGVAFQYGWNCLKAALMAFIHGVVPGLYKTGASDLVKKLSSGRRGKEQTVQPSE